MKLKTISATAMPSTFKSLGEVSSDRKLASEKLRRAEQLRTEVKSAMQQLTKKGHKCINLTDGDANLMKGRQGIIPSYNLEAVVSPLKVDETYKTGVLMTGVELVPEPEDQKQLIPMMEQSEEMTGKVADMTLADAGFHSSANLAACEQRNRVTVMPEAREKRYKTPITRTGSTMMLIPIAISVHMVRP